MADSRTFTLIGKFDDHITGHLESINNTLTGLKRTLGSFSVRSGGFDDLTKSMGKVVSAHKILKQEVIDLRSEFSKSLTVIREYKSALASAGQISTRNTRANIAALNAETAAWGRVTRAAENYHRKSGGRSGGGGGGGRDGGGGGRNITGDIVSGNLISNAIIGGFQVGVGILQQGMNVAFNALAERSKDQMEDIASSGGIYAAFKYNKIPGGPKSFQDAMDLQDNINKEMAIIAANLPGTTHDYVENSRRLVDTTGQIMAKDFKGFTDLAKKLTGNININAKDAFTAVNVDIAKSTTMLEKLNPSRSVVPMTQLVEDMMKDDKVTVGGLRKYVAFKRSTTFQAALDRHLEELNAAGASTAKRLAVISKILKEAVPAPMVNAFMISVGGVTEGFRSAFLDPDMGIFGLSRRLTQTVIKYNRETGEKMGTEITNFYKVFSETFGNLGNLVNNSILPGLAAVYSPFEGIANSLKNLRDYSFRIFKAQQEYTQYFQDLADKYGMSADNFQVSQKGGLTVIMDMMRSINALSANKYSRYQTMMQAQGSAQEISDRMTAIYKDIIPEFFNSPIMKTIGKEIAKALAQVFKEIANLLRALMGEKTGASEFLTAFNAAGGMKAINDILVLLSEAIGKAIFELVKLYTTALGSAITSGNLAASLVLASPLALLAGPLSGLLGKGGGGGGGSAGGGLLSKLFTSKGTTAAAGGIRAAAGGIRGLAGGALAPYGRAASTIGAFAAGSNVVKAARFIPGASLAIGAADAGLRMAGGQSAGEAVGHAASTVIGSTLGGILGQALIPVPGLGAAIGSVAGGFIGDKFADMVIKTFWPAADAQNRAAEAQKKAAEATNEATKAAQRKYGAAGEKLGGVEAISRKYGGGEGYKKAINAQYVAGKISTTEYLKQNALADQMTNLNLSTEKVASAQKAYDEAVRLNTKDQTELAGKLKTAQEQQAKATVATTAAWESMNATSQRNILNAAGAITTAMTQAAINILANGGHMPTNGTDPTVAAFLKGQASYNPQFNNPSPAPSIPPPASKGFKSSYFNITPPPPQPAGPFSLSQAYGSPGVGFNSLSGALSYEMANKPSGSRLVLANSSETIIPAAGGLGMGGLIDAIFSAAQNTVNTLTQGFASLKQVTAVGDQGIITTQKQTAKDTQESIAKSTQAQLAGQQQLMAAIKEASLSGAAGGGGGGGGPLAGGSPAIAALARQAGFSPGEANVMAQIVKAESGNNPRAFNPNASTGDLSYGLAQINMLGGMGPERRRMFGISNNEQLYDPLTNLRAAYQIYKMGGWKQWSTFTPSMLSGSRALNVPRYFPNAREAINFETAMMPAGAQVRQMYANTSELGGGGMTINAPITIHQQPGQDADYLAAVVVQKMGEWVSDARSSSIFV